MKKPDIAFWWREFQWKMYDIATILFDDTKNDMRSLPKTVRLQILVYLSIIWSTVFTVFVWESLNEVRYGWGGLVFGHIFIILAAYYTFRTFKNIKSDYSKYGNTVGSWDDCMDYLKQREGKNEKTS